MAEAGILVVGALHLDILIDAPHLPRADETVMGSNARYVCGGKGGNQAAAAARHGAHVTMAACVGSDGFGATLTEHLHAAGVGTDQLQRVDDTPSGMSVAIIDPAGDYGAVVASGANQRLNASAIRLPGDARFVIAQNEIPEAVNLEVARMARRAGARFVLNAAPMRQLPRELLELVDVLIVNRLEGEEFLGAELSTVSEALPIVADRPASPAQLIVTMGGDGLIHHRIGDSANHVPAFAVDIVSTHGAGDAFVGALCARLAKGEEMASALIHAQAAAALLVSTAEVERASIDADAVERFLRESGRPQAESR